MYSTVVRFQIRGEAAVQTREFRRFSATISTKFATQTSSNGAYPGSFHMHSTMMYDTQPTQGLKVLQQARTGRKWKLGAMDRNGSWSEFATPEAPGAGSDTRNGYDRQNYVLFLAWWRERQGFTGRSSADAVWSKEFDVRLGGVTTRLRRLPLKRM
jgi:hypothetical protein